MNNLQTLHQHGQSAWLDNIRKDLLDGGLQGLIDQGLRGLTSNPAIFEKAIAGSDLYDAALAALLASGERDPERVVERLMIEDLQRAADQFLPVFEESGGVDGFVSLEVSPHLAHDAEGTIAAGRRLFAALNRPNAMIKVPATPAGLVAIETLCAEGIPVNVTLLFSRQQYQQVVEAHRRAGGNTASVASFFISRIDAALDPILAASGREALQGQVALANAKLAYQDFLSLNTTQRLLWASTGTKNPRYSDVLYVNELIGKHTVNTVPPATLHAFIDHGTVAETLTQNLDAARKVLAQVPELESVCQRLLAEGLQLFVVAWDQLLAAVAGKITTNIAQQTAATGQRA